jgi:hypothetical protein
MLRWGFLLLGLFSPSLWGSPNLDSVRTTRGISRAAVPVPASMESGFLAR